MLLRRKLVIYIFSFLILAAIVYFAFNYREKLGKIIVPFIMAMVIAYLVHPIVLKLEERKVSRTTSIILIYLVFGVIVTTITIFIVPQFIDNTRELINTLPEITLEYRNNFNGMMKLIHTSKWPPDIKNAIFREINNGAAIAENMMLDALRNSLTGLIKTVSAMFDLILAMILAYYLIKDAEFFREGALSLVPRKWRNGIISACREINDILSRFIQGQLLTALIIGIMSTIGLFIIGVKYPLILGMISGIANIIPYFGPFIGAIPAVAVALIESPIKALWAVVVFVIIQQIDNTFVTPKIIEGRLGLHPVTTILAVLVGGEFFGIIGMLVAVPAAAIIKVVVKRSIEAIV